MWGENAQVDGDGRDALVGARYPVGLGLDFRAHLVKIHKLLSFAVQEFGIFCMQGDGGEVGVGVGEVRRGGEDMGRDGRRTKGREEKG